MRPVRELGRTQYIFLSEKHIATFGVDIVSSKVVSRKIDAISSETRMRASPDAIRFTMSKKDTKISNVVCVEQLFFLLFYRMVLCSKHDEVYCSACDLLRPFVNLIFIIEKPGNIWETHIKIIIIIIRGFIKTRKRSSYFFVL